MRPSRARVLLALLLPWPGLAPGQSETRPHAPATVSASKASPTSAVSDVWAREDAYWRFAKAGDVNAYLSLWHPRFAGWQCTTPHPSTKATIGDWVQDIHDRKLVLDYSITRERAEEFGDVVVVYYTTPITRTSADGEIQWAGRSFKLTHTWQKDPHKGWQIIGGMCGELAGPSGHP